MFAKGSLVRPICHLKNLRNWGTCHIRMCSSSPCTLWALNTDVSIPADCNTDLIHLATIAFETGLYGLINDKNNFETNMLLYETLSAAVREMYSFNTVTGQIKAQSDDEKETSRDFLGLEVFKRSLSRKLIEF